VFKHKYYGLVKKVMDFLSAFGQSAAVGAHGAERLSFA